MSDFKTQEQIWEETVAANEIKFAKKRAAAAARAAKKAAEHAATPEGQAEARREAYLAETRALLAAAEERMASERMCPETREQHEGRARNASETAARAKSEPQEQDLSAFYAGTEAKLDADVVTTPAPVAVPFAPVLYIATVKAECVLLSWVAPLRGTTAAEYAQMYGLTHVTADRTEVEGMGHLLSLEHGKPIRRALP